MSANGETTCTEIKTRILNVNDSASHRYYVSRVLKSAGWDVLEAATGADGLQLAHEQKPDVVILDVKLPDMSGLDVCRMLRNDPQTAHLIVIQTSATFISSEGKARGLESGADQYLTQPFESVELIAMVRNLLRLREKEVESRERAQALAIADQRKDEFLAMLGHELRNPLAAITVAASLLNEQGLDARGQKLSATIARQTRHLSKLVDDLLDVSRITRGKIQLRSQPLDLAAMVKGFVGGDLGAKAREHELSLRIADEPMWIDADPTRVEQILSNLLNNAIKYTERGGRIAVSLTPGVRDGSSVVVLKIRDTGIGIAKEKLASIFDLFFQVDDSLERSQSGLGIGLTMVKRLVEMQGGRIFVDSDGLGRGCEFRVELGRIAAPGALPKVDPADTQIRPLSVLLVDDNVDSCELWALAFEQEGHRADCASDGEEGLSKALAGSYDVAVIDIGLPGLDGYELARRIRAHSFAHGSQPALIALTGYGREEDRKRALDAGFDFHLVKPIDVMRLASIVEQVMAKRERLNADAKRSA